MVKAVLSPGRIVTSVTGVILLRKSNLVFEYTKKYYTKQWWFSSLIFLLFFFCCYPLKYNIVWIQGLITNGRKILLNVCGRVFFVCRYPLKNNNVWCRVDSFWFTIFFDLCGRFVLLLSLYNILFFFLFLSIFSACSHGFYRTSIKWNRYLMVGIIVSCYKKKHITKSNLVIECTKKCHIKKWRFSSLTFLLLFSFCYYPSKYCIVPVQRR